VGKTHFALSVAYAVASGTKFLRWHAPVPRKVVYLDGEMPGSVMQRRLAMHCPDHPPAPGFFKIFTPDLVPDGQTLPDLATLDGQDALNLMIEDDTALVVVDNLSAWARSGGRENDAESWLPIADWILSLRRRGIAVLLVHHAGKGGQQRGTSKKEDVLDVVIGLSRPADYDPKAGASFVVEFTKARNLLGDDAESLELELGGTDERAEWHWRTVEASTYERVVKLQKEGLKPNEIAAELGIHKSNVSRHLSRARQLGDVVADEKGAK
jgi:putative DNA primase/helicase